MFAYFCYFQYLSQCISKYLTQKAFNHYTSNPVSENQNQLFLFLIVIWISYMKPELFYFVYYKKLTSTRERQFIKRWENLTPVLIKNWWTSIVNYAFVPSLWVITLSDPLSGDATFKKFVILYRLLLVYIIFPLVPVSVRGKTNNIYFI